MKHRVNPDLIKELSTKALWPWVRDAIMDWGIMIGALTIASAFPNPITIVLAVLIVGNRQHALAILGHDGTHFTLSKNRLLNDSLTNFFNMWPVGLTVGGYRKLHFQHHRALGTHEDPELHHKKSRAPQWDLPIKWTKIFKYTLYDLIGYSIPDYWIIITYSKPEKRSEFVGMVLFHILTVSILLASGLWLTALIWYFSLVTSFMLFFRLRLWLEHQGTDETNRLKLNWWQGGLLSPHNGWYHWEHHNWASIPYHRLPEFRERMGSEKPVLTLNDLIKGFDEMGPISSGANLRGSEVKA